MNLVAGLISDVDLNRVGFIVACTGNKLLSP